MHADTPKHNTIARGYRGPHHKHNGKDQNAGQLALQKRLKKKYLTMTKKNDNAKLRVSRLHPSIPLFCDVQEEFQRVP